MAKETKYGIRELQEEFPNDDTCLEYLFDTLHTRDCSCGGRYGRVSGRKQFQCSKCRYQIAPMAGTLFEKSSSPLTLWFHAIFIFSNAKSGISAKEMERQLNVTYKTAWRMLKLIRASLKQDTRPLNGIVEMDEAFFGGRGDGGKYNKNYKQVMAEKAKVIGAVERGGEMRVKKVPNLTADTIGGFLADNVQEQGTCLMTDESNRYDNVAVGYDRHTVNHSSGQYAVNGVHVNHIESFWAHVKRSIKGTHKVVSRKHLQEYLDGFVFHYNNRDNDRMRFASLLGAVVR